MVGGVITNGLLDKQGGDLWTIDPIPNSKGYWEKKGWAKYLDGYHEPKKWGTEAYLRAGLGLQSTKTEPGPPWSEADAFHRWYRMDYNCCNGKSESSLTSWDGDTRRQIDK